MGRDDVLDVAAAAALLDEPEEVELTRGRERRLGLVEEVDRSAPAAEPLAEQGEESSVAAPWART
jgi:hypothetical protein